MHKYQCITAKILWGSLDWFEQHTAESVPHPQQVIWTNPEKVRVRVISCACRHTCHSLQVAWRHVPPAWWWMAKGVYYSLCATSRRTHTIALDLQVMTLCTQCNISSWHIPQSLWSILSHTSRGGRENRSRFYLVTSLNTRHQQSKPKQCSDIKVWKSWVHADL